MTTRDSRRDWRTGPVEASASGRDPTQSLEVELDPDSHPSLADSHPSLAVGTHEGQRAQHGDERTKVESPSGRQRPSSRPEPARGSGRRPPLPPDRAIDDPAEHVGAILGSYRVIELLGKGGMGYVYRSEHVKLGREVALKLLRSDYSRRRDAVARFFQEARTVNRVRHRNIVDVTDFVELDDGTTFIIMELLSGVSLGKWSRTGVDLPRALAVLVQICDGLGAAHSVGVIHRDLKPDNVIVIPTSDGAELVKLLDFGVAKLLNRDDEDVGFQTAAGSVIGTPAYMSPEQAGGMLLDHRSDIYSLGAIMYELFCGQPMFRGRSFGEYVRKHLTEQPTPPRQTQGGAGLDPRLEALIMRCLDKEPTQRFESIYELRDALLTMLGTMETHPPAYVSTGSGLHQALPVAPPVQPHPTPISQLSAVHASAVQYSHHSQVTPPPPTRQTQPTPWWVWVFGGIAAVSIGIAAALWYAGRGDSDPPQVTATPTPVATPKPATAQPIEPAPPAPAALVELRFDSLPAGGVYSDGRSAELCKTPCAFDVDPKDGGATRKFIVKSAGYKDATVEVDLAAAQREFRVTLEREVADRPTEKLEPVADTPGKKDPRRVIRSTKKGNPKDDKVDKSPKDDKVDKPEKPTEKKPFDDHLMKPEDDKAAGEKRPDKKPPDKKPGSDTIDPSETLDPFRRPKPQ